MSFEILFPASSNSPFLIFTIIPLQSPKLALYTLLPTTTDIKAHEPIIAAAGNPSRYAISAF